MKKSEFLAIIYETKNGERPFENFYNSLDKKMKAKISMLINLLQEYGNKLAMPYSKYIRDGIFELRASANNSISRTFYFFIKDKKIVITHGFIKKTQRTPKSEIDKAIKYKSDWEAENGIQNI